VRNISFRDTDSILKGFTACYKDAFGGAPYFETYTDNEVLRSVWLPHIEHGVTVFAFDGEAIIGFACALPMCYAPEEIREFLRGKTQEGIPLDLLNAWYISEIGVATTHRGRGLGYALTREQLRRIRSRGGAQYALRTAANGSNSFKMYVNIGSTIIEGIQNVSTSEQVCVNGSKSKERVYLYGSCDAAIIRINARP
jgi:ribosomal protein S18 acetylase RimI-like enzyme